MLGRWQVQKEVQQAQEEAQEHYRNWFAIGVEVMSQGMFFESEEQLEVHSLKVSEELTELLNGNPTLEEEEEFLEKFKEITNKLMEEKFEDSTSL